MIALALLVIAGVALVVLAWITEDPDRKCGVSGHPIRECHCALHSWMLQ